MTVGTVTSKQGTDLGPLINAAAERNLLATRALTAQLISESNLDELAARYGAWPDVSFGLGQQTVAYANVGDGTDSPENIAAVRAYFFEPANAIEECAQQLGYYWGWFADLDDEQRFYEASSRYNGGARMAFKDNPNQMNIMRGWTEAAQYESEAPMPTTRTYDPSIPRIPQTDPWSCSVASLCWCLRSVGIDQSYPALEQAELAAGIVSTIDGLLVASGGPLAEWVAETWGLTTDHDPDVSWEWLQEHAGTMPIMLGGRHWGVAGHWVGVREVDPAGQCRIANPADGYAGIFETLTENDFNRVGPCSVVWIVVEEAEDVGKIEELTNNLDYLKGDVADAFESAITTLEQTPRLPKAARDAVAGGLRPALDTLRRGGPPEDGG